MRKITLLSAVALFAGALSANAQLVDGTDYIIQNVESGKYLGGANSWGTQASLVEHPQIFTAKLQNGKYVLDSHTYNNANNHFLGENNYVDSPAAEVKLEAVEGGAYKLTVGATAYGVNGNVTNGSGNATWKVTSVADALVAAKAKAAEGESSDVTFLIKDAGFGRNLYNKSFEPAWDIVANNCNIAGGANDNMCAESWRSAFKVSQTIKVPNGVYTLNAQASVTEYTVTGQDIPYVFANDQKSAFCVSPNSGSMAGGETSMSAMSTSFSAGKYLVEPIIIEVTDGTLTYGVEGTRTDTWCIWDNFTLELNEWEPTVGELEINVENSIETAANSLQDIVIKAPNADYLEGYELTSGWNLYEGENLIVSGAGTDELVISNLPLETGKTYVLKYVFQITKDRFLAAISKGEIEIRTLTTKELAIYNYNKALEEAWELYDYADEHKGVGLMLYLPSKVERYADNLLTAQWAIGNPTTYVDAKEGEQVIRGLMCELTPQYPKLNQRYLVQHKASGLYMNVADDKVTLAAAPTPVMFHHVEGADIDASFYMYSTQDNKYVYYTGDNTWSLTGQKTSNKLGQWIIKHNHTTQAYNLVGANGALGSDAAEAASALYGNKAEDAANSQWLLSPYTEPEPSDDVIATGDYYIRNRETGKYLGGANAWGTQASLLDNANSFTATMINDGIYNLDSHIYNNASSHFLGVDGYVDQAAAELSIIPTGDGYYTIASGEKYYSAPASGTVLEMGANAGAKSQWQFLTKADLLAEVAAGESDNLTFLIKDADFSRNYMSQETNPWDIAPAKGGDNTNMNAEKWGGNSQEFDSHQTVEIPNGVYRISCQGYYRYNNTTENTNQVAIDSHADGTEVINSYLYANDKAVALKSIADDEAASALSSLPFSQSEASAAFGKGLYQNEVVVTVTDGKLTIGIKKTSHPGCDWTVWDNFQIHTSSAAEAALFAALNPIVESEATEISSVSSSSAPAAIYSANGARLQSMQKGINIVKMSDGSVKKVMVK